MDNITKEEIERLEKLIEEIHQHLSIQDTKLNHIITLLQER